MKYSGVENRNIKINEDSKISGVINGNVTVLESFKLTISGCVSGDVYLQKNTQLKVSGMVTGNVYKADDSIKIKNSGMISGRIYENNEVEKQKIDEDKKVEDSIDSVLKSIENSSITINNNSKYGFKGTNIFSNNSNISIIGNKKVRVLSNSGMNISTSRGKTIVNGIDLDTLTPDEDGIYTIK